MTEVTWLHSTGRQSARMSKITNERLNPVWYRMLYSCTHMATVGVKGFRRRHWRGASESDSRQLVKMFTAAFVSLAVNHLALLTVK